MKFTISFPEAGMGVTLNCNNENAYEYEQLNLLWKCIILLLGGTNHLPAEIEFIDHWIAADFLPKNLKAEWELAATDVHPGRVDLEFKTALRLLRPKLVDLSGRATAYKHLVAAALHSARSKDRLMAMMVTARDVLEIEATIATLISDGIAAEMPNFPHSPTQLTQDDRETILAIVIIVLNADGQKDIREITAMRLVMLALNITVANNANLAAMAKKGMPALVAGISAAALPTALLNIVRLVIADRSVHESERQVILAIAAKMKRSEVQAICRLAMLESGILFEV